jgi:uncharacterized membrane protein YfcA
VDLDWLLVLAALVVGVLVGLTGVGAGAIMTPLLVGVFGVSLPVAVATDLLFATVTKAVGVGFHHRIGSINWATARTLWAGSIPGTLVGVLIVLFVVDKTQASWLTWPLAALVLLTAFILGRRALGYTPNQRRLIGASSRAAGGKGSKVLPAAGGFGIGAAVAMTSVGAGALGMALLVSISPANERPQNLVGTDLVHAIPLALVAGVAYGGAGLVSWPLLGELLLGSIPGVVLGTLLAGRVNPRVMQGILAAILVAVVGILVFR